MAGLSIPVGPSKRKFQLEVSYQEDINIKIKTTRFSKLQHWIHVSSLNAESSPNRILHRGLEITSVLIALKPLMHSHKRLQCQLLYVSKTRTEDCSVVILRFYGICE